MRTPGTYISAVGHVGLIGWLFFGYGFDADPLEFDFSEVSIVSGDEFAAILAATTPQPDVADPPAPALPVIDDTPPAVEPETTPQVTPAPVQTEAPASEAPPPEAPEPPAPPSEVADVAPSVPAQPAPEAAPDLNISPRPQPRPADRVAPTPVAPPPPDADIAEVLQDAVVPDESTPAEVVEPSQEATAPEEAATEIVTEADAPSGAVQTSARPQSRPNRPAPAAPAQTETATASTDTSAEDAAVEAALEAALAAVAPDLPAGPPLTGSEREGFRLAVNDCWNVDPGSQAARVTMTVAFRLDQSGRLDGEVRQVAASGGDEGATSIAFQAARRAIIRCGTSGYDLPAEKYDQWRDVEITFDPSGMRLR